jgi:hypothetical protein
MLWSGDFDHENTYRNRNSPVVLNIKPEADKDMKNYSDFSCIYWGRGGGGVWILEKMTNDREGSRYRNYDAAPDQFLEFSLRFQRNKQKLYPHFSLEQSRLKI